jgi:hypothetical protein
MAGPEGVRAWRLIHPAVGGPVRHPVGVRREAQQLREAGSYVDFTRALVLSELPWPPDAAAGTHRRQLLPARPQVPHPAARPVRRHLRSGTAAGDRPAGRNPSWRDHSRRVAGDRPRTSRFPVTGREQTARTGHDWPSPGRPHRPTLVPSRRHWRWPVLLHGFTPSAAGPRHTFAPARVRRFRNRRACIMKCTTSPPPQRVDLHDDEGVAGDQDAVLRSRRTSAHRHDRQAAAPTAAATSPHSSQGQSPSGGSRTRVPRPSGSEVPLGMAPRPCAGTLPRGKPGPGL